MLDCREISKLVSESMEHELPWRVRMQMWMHLAMCRWCLGFARQLRLLRRAVREHPNRLIKDDADAATSLSQEARGRIQAAVEEAGN